MGRMQVLRQGESSGADGARTGTHADNTGDSGPTGGGTAARGGAVRDEDRREHDHGQGEGR